MEGITKSPLDQNLIQIQKPIVEENNSNKSKVGVFQPTLTVNEYSDPETENEEEEGEEEEDETSEDEYDDQLLSIDIHNLSNPLKLAKYAEQIFSEATLHESIPPLTQKAFFSKQTEITPDDREEAGKWLYSLQAVTRSCYDTLFNACSFLNIVVTRIPIPSQQFLLYIVVCFWIASKMEEKAPITVQDLISIKNCAQYNEQDFLRCEKTIISALDFHLNYPTSKFFLRRYLDVIDANEEIIEASNFFNDISIFRIEFLDFSPTTIALSAVCLGKLALGDYCPTSRLMNYAKRTDIETIKGCASLILKYASIYLKQKEKSSLVERYSDSTLHGVIRQLNTSPELLQHL